MVKKLLVVISISFLLFTSCSNKTMVDSNHDMKKIIKANSPLNETNIENDVSTLESMLKEKKKLSNEFAWIKDTDWEKIVIKKTGSKCVRTIEDGEIIRSFVNYITFDYEYYEYHRIYPNIPCYTYILQNNETKVEIKLLSSEIVKFKNRYFKTNKIYKLGDALMPIDKCKTGGTIETKIANSGFVKDTKDIKDNDRFIWEDWRIYMAAKTLTEEKKIPNKPDVKLEDPEDTFLFLYFGEKIKLNVFKNYVQIIDECNNEFWYEFIDEKAYKYISLPLVGLD